MLDRAVEVGIFKNDRFGDLQPEGSESTKAGDPVQLQEIESATSAQSWQTEIAQCIGAAAVSHHIVEDQIHVRVPRIRQRIVHMLDEALARALRFGLADCDDDIVSFGLETEPERQSVTPNAVDQNSQGISGGTAAGALPPSAERAERRSSRGEV